MYLSEVSAGGGGGPNWVALWTSSGVAIPSQGSNIDRNPGGVGPPDAGRGRLAEEDGCVSPVVGAQCDQVVGYADTEGDAVRLGFPGRGSVLAQLCARGVQGGLGVGEVGHQHLVGGGYRRGLG